MTVTKPNLKPSARGGRLLWAGLGVLALAAAAGAAVLRSRNGESGLPPLFTAFEGPLTISITETGTLRARDQVSVRSEVEGQNTIIFLIPEGTLVEKGELLVELDSSRFQDQLVDQEIRVQNTEAAFIRAQENLEVVRNQAQADVARAELNARFAREDLSVYRDGEYPNRLRELESRIVLAEAELQRARQREEGSRVLFEQRYISQTELEADQLSARRAALDLELAKERLALETEHMHQRQVEKLDAEATQAELALERTRRRARADVVQAEADHRAREAEHRRQQDRLERIKEQIAKSRIIAPQAGLVVYATSTQATWRGSQDPLQEGQQVRERQDLIFLPAAEQMMVRVQVQEAVLQLVRRGLPVRVAVEALPDRTFPGRVARIAPLPDAGSMFLNPNLKVYDVDIHLEEVEPDLRTGMGASAQILAAHLDQVVQIPVHAVVRQGTQPVVYVRTRNGFETRPVEVGLDNRRMIHIRSGLRPGEVVSLAPPLSEAEAAPPEFHGTDLRAEPMPQDVPPPAEPAGPGEGEAPDPTSLRPGGRPPGGFEGGRRRRETPAEAPAPDAGTP